MNCELKCDKCLTHINRITLERPVGENNSTRPLNSKIKANAGEKQLNSSVGTKQLNSTGENNSTRQHERNNSTGENNSTQQQERTTQLVSRNETTQLNRRKQLNSSVGTKQLNSALPSTACNRLQPPTTACNRLQPPTTAYNRLQPPATAYNRLHRLYSRIGFFYLLTIKSRVNATIANRGNSYETSADFFEVLRIMDMILFQPFNVNLGNFSREKLADENFSIPGNIDLLLGAEIFYEIILPGQTNLLNTKLIFQNTVFGYIASGSISVSSKNKPHCGLIKDNVDLEKTEDFGKRNMPSKRARRHFSQLSEFERGLIIGMKTAGWSTRRVAGQVGRSECAIRNSYEQWTREGTLAWKTESRATRKTTRREDRRIVRQVLVDPTVTRSTIRADLSVAIVPQTISRHLAEANLKSKHLFHALPLTSGTASTVVPSQINVECHRLAKDSSMAGPLPDLSPVEHVWDQLKRQMPSCHSVHDLELAVQDLWAHLPQDNIRCLINSMPDRVVACIAAGGGPTRY
ncbi:transposable element Tcb2 transposase [Trichonephila clavipes]|uniref:Transposable element Tcb2 transposase n=1 Tax=Trichonephila clavipes TaxID=2585209 RepID=A0A8X6VTX8_TRICX|nr:transposable element Tcb2 transposase [Trichonephila clavipes]